MNIRIIQVPYDSGYKDVRQGLGPAVIFQKGLDRNLEKQGHQVEALRIEAHLSFPTEIATAFELNRLLAEQVKSAERENAFPLVLSGNCNSCLGVLAGLESSRLGVVWFDAHGEFNTPETTGSGWLDGMPLAMATGRCWTTLLKTIPGFQPVQDENIILVGARDLDPVEEERLGQSGITLVRTGIMDESRLLETIDAPLDDLRSRVDGVYIHIDMDALDLNGGRANHLHPPGGITPDGCREIIARVKTRFPVRGATVASYDPAVDDGPALAAVVGMIETITASMP